jgi:chorismate dehydratase
LTKKANLAFISSIASKKSLKTCAGIVAKNDVQSVIALPGENKDDTESATSNVLAKVLGINGQVLIGDKALKKTLETNDYIDLAKVWNDKFNLPFVFAILCYNSEYSLSRKLARQFTTKKIYIPQTILNAYSKSRQIPKVEILKYLKKISYKIGKKELLGYKKFIVLARNR